MAESLSPTPPQPNKSKDELPAKMELPKGYQPNLTPADQTFLEDYFRGVRDNPTRTAVLVCRGQNCPIYAHCPLAQLGKTLPVGKACPVERTLIDMWTRDLIHELGIDKDDHVDLSQVSELVRTMLFTKRAHEILSTSDAVIQVFKGRTEDGDAIFEPRLHPMMYTFEKDRKVKETILNALIATREAKSKDKSRTVTSAADIAANLMQKIRDLHALENKTTLTNIQYKVNDAEKPKDK